MVGEMLVLLAAATRVAGRTKVEVVPKMLRILQASTSSGSTSVQESGLLEQVLGEHPYPHHVYCIKIRANSFCSPLEQFLIFVSLTPHIL
jgi:hypothetical protein